MGKKKGTISGKLVERTGEEGELASFQPTVVPGQHKHLARLYANWFRVQHTGLDFTFFFGEIEPPTDEEEAGLRAALKAGKTPVIEARPVVKIVVRPELVEAIIQALADNLKKFRERTEKEE